jgi:hypothetical protein
MATKLPRCKNGTRRNKQSRNCEPTKAASSLTPNKKIPKKLKNKTQKKTIQFKPPKMMKTELEVECYNTAIRILKETIAADLTIGRTDYNEDNEGGHLEPYSQEQIDEFIRSYKKLIEKTAKTIIKEYKEDDESELKMLLDEKTQKSRISEYWHNEEVTGLTDDYNLQIINPLVEKIKPESPQINLYDIAVKIIEEIIGDDFTVKRQEKGLEPYSQEEINNFIHSYNKNINKTANEYLKRYNQLYLLQKPNTKTTIGKYWHDEKVSGLPNDYNLH